MAVKTQKKAEKKLSYEDSVKKLESIVASLESGELPLEEQLKSFEKGVELSRECFEQLESIERRIEKLVESNKGQLKTEEFSDIK